MPTCFDKLTTKFVPFMVSPMIDEVVYAALGVLHFKIEILPSVINIILMTG